MRRHLPVIAVVVVVLSMASGLWILTSNVTPPGVNHPELSCAGVFGSLQGDPNYGGELPYPRDWVDQCRDAAQDRVRWIAVPAVAGPVALLYLLGAFVMTVRRAKAEGRSTGALTG